MIAPVLPPGLDTPALVIDLDIVERNARRLGDALADRGIALRPHVKTHKSVGARADPARCRRARASPSAPSARPRSSPTAGIDDIFIAYPIWADGPKAARLRALHERAGCGWPSGSTRSTARERLAAAVARLAAPLRVLLELDPGNRRTGAPAEAAGEIAGAARRLGLEVRRRLHPRRPRATGPAGPSRPAPTRSRRSPSGASRASRSRASSPSSQRRLDAHRSSRPRSRPSTRCAPGPT